MSLLYKKTGYEIKQQILAILNKAKFHLSSDTSAAALSLKQAIEEYVNTNSPALSDFIVLSNYIHNYQNQLSDNQITLRNMAEELINFVSNIIHHIKIGNSSLTSTSPKEHVFDATYSNILEDLKNKINALNNPSRSTIVETLMQSFNSNTNVEVRNKILIDLYAGGLDASTIKSLIYEINLNSPDQFTIASAIYNLFSSTGFTMSDVAGAVSLGDYLHTSINFSSVENILADIKSGIASLSGEDLTIDNIVNMILSAMGVGKDEAIKNYLMLDMYSSNLSAEQIKTNIASISGVDGPSIAVSIYGAFNYGAGSASSGEIMLMNAIKDNGINSSLSSLQSLSTRQDIISYADLASSIVTSLSNYGGSDLITRLKMDMVATGVPVENIIANIANLAGEDAASITVSLYNIFGLGRGYNYLAGNIVQKNADPYYVDYNDIRKQISAISSDDSITTSNQLATAIASVLQTSSIDLSLVNALETDINDSGSSVATIKTYLLSITGVDPNSIAASIYQTWSSAYFSAMQGATLLAMNMENNSLDSSSLNALADRGDTLLTNHQIAVAIDAIVNNVPDDNMIKYLESDFTYSGLLASQILAILGSLIASDGASTVAALYKSLGIPYASAISGEQAMQDSIEAYFYSDYVVTISSQNGDYDISPSAVYLNKCIKIDEVYNVLGSVFASFDNDNQGIALNSMTQLGTNTGNFMAMADCGAWIDYTISSGGDLYITKTKMAGITGDSNETGCSELLDPGLALAKCWSAFSHIPN